MRGYPIGTVAFYGPDDQRATKVVASILTAENQPPDSLRKWFCEDGDVRNDKAAIEQVAQFLRDAGVRSKELIMRKVRRVRNARSGRVAIVRSIYERLTPGRIPRGKRGAQPSVVRTRVSNWSP